MAALLNAAYDDLRAARVVQWEMEIRDDVNAPVLRVAAADPRLTVTDNAGTDTTTFAFVLSGDDLEVTLPLTVASSVLFTPGGGAGVQMTAQEAFTPFTLGAAEDEVTITHDVVLPTP